MEASALFESNMRALLDSLDSQQNSNIKTWGYI